MFMLHLVKLLDSTGVLVMQNKLARVVIDRVPCLETVRFVNSGTEACLSVLRLMRAFTGRNKVTLHLHSWCNFKLVKQKGKLGTLSTLCMPLLLYFPDSLPSL